MTWGRRYKGAWVSLEVMQPPTLLLMPDVR